MRKFDNYLGIPRSRKVKHVKIFLHNNPWRLEDQINQFADDHPEFKILGVKISSYDDYESDGHLMAVVTFLEDAKGVEYEDYEEEEVDE